MIVLHFQETFIGMKLTGQQLTMLIFPFRTEKYGHFCVRESDIRSWNYVQDMLKINLSLKHSTPNSIKYFLIKCFIENY